MFIIQKSFTALNIIINLFNNIERTQLFHSTNQFRSDHGAVQRRTVYAHRALSSLDPHNTGVPMQLTFYDNFIDDNGIEIHEHLASTQQQLLVADYDRPVLGFQGVDTDWVFYVPYECDQHKTNAASKLK
jgi:hypothetical protein